MIRLAPVLLAVCASLVLAACGTKEEDTTATPQRQQVTVVLDYFPNADHGPLYAALGAGDFEQAGLDVELVAPSDPSAPLKLLQAGRADIAISYTPELLLANDKGADLLAVGALVQEPLTSIISLPNGKVRSPDDLEGKTVATAGIPYQAAYLETIAREAGIDPDSIKQVDVGFNLTPALTSKKADASLGAFWNYEGVQLERQKKDPTIIKIQDVGVPSYDELIFTVAKTTAEDRGPMLRRFLQAVADGARRMKADPKAAVDPLMEAAPDLDRGLQTAVIEATMPVFFPSDPEKPFGFLDDDQWARYTRWMVDNELLSRAPGARPYTTEFLPGEALDDGDEPTS